MTERIIEDGRGRRLSVRPLTMIDRLRLFKALGGELSMNDAYLGVASLAASVMSIDGLPMLFPMGEAAVETAVERLGEDGIEAVAMALEPIAAEEIKAQAGN